MILKAGLKQGHDDQFLEQLGFMRNIKREMKAMHNLFLFYVLVECKKTKAAKENEKKIQHELNHPGSMLLGRIMLQKKLSVEK